MDVCIFSWWIWSRLDRLFHHCQILTIIIGLKDSVASTIFQKYSVNTPKDNFMIPRKSINHFSSLVMSRTNDFGMMFAEYSLKNENPSAICTVGNNSVRIDITDWFRELASNIANQKVPIFITCLLSWINYKAESLWKSLITCIDMHESPKINTRFLFENQVKCSQTLI